MTKAGTLRITANPGTKGAGAYFEVVFLPYAGRLNTIPVNVSNHDDLVALLMDLKIDEDEATRWAGKARAQGIVLISGVERTELLLREKGLLV